ncbi:unnamed protein product, partial [Discosporangium mesarthrocarpum]
GEDAGVDDQSVHSAGGTEGWIGQASSTFSGGDETEAFYRGSRELSEIERQGCGRARARVGGEARDKKASLRITAVAKDVVLIIPRNSHALEATALRSEELVVEVRSKKGTWRLPTHDTPVQARRQAREPAPTSARHPDRPWHASGGEAGDGEQQQPRRAPVVAPPPISIPPRGTGENSFASSCGGANPSILSVSSANSHTVGGGSGLGSTTARGGLGAPGSVGGRVHGSQHM